MPGSLLNRRGLLSSAMLVVLIAGAVFGFYEAQRRAVVSVRVAGDLRYTPRADLEQAVATHIASSLYAVDVDSVRAAALSQVWVKHASVRRVWPESLHIAVIERTPVARWGESGLLEADGSVFYPSTLEDFERLPVLEGPSGSEAVLLQRFGDINQMLATVSRQVARLSLDERRAWQLELDNGVEILMGQNEQDQVLQRLVDVFHGVLQAEPAELERVDLRYTNGFAVQWKHQPPARGGEEQG